MCGNVVMKKINKKPIWTWQKCRKKERQRRIDLINKLGFFYGEQRPSVDITSIH